MSLHFLEDEEVERLKRMLQAWESGRLNPGKQVLAHPLGAPIETRIALTTSVITGFDHDAGQAGSGTVTYYSLNPDMTFSGQIPEDETVYSLAACPCPVNQLVYIVRDPFSGAGFVVRTTCPTAATADLELTDQQTDDMSIPLDDNVVIHIMSSLTDPLVTGMVGNGSGGQQITFLNVNDLGVEGMGRIFFAHDNSSSTSPHRFYLPAQNEQAAGRGAPVCIRPKESCSFYYDDEEFKWKLLSQSWGVGLQNQALFTTHNADGSGLLCQKWCGGWSHMSFDYTVILSDLNRLLSFNTTATITLSNGSDDLGDGFHFWLTSSAGTLTVETTPPISGLDDTIDGESSLTIEPGSLYHLSYSSDGRDWKILNKIDPNGTIDGGTW